MAEKTFKQLVLQGKGGPWTINAKPIPKAGVGQIAVKMTACSICNQSDLNTVRALHPPHDHQIEGMVPHHFRQWDNRLDGDPLQDAYPSQRYELEPYPTTMGHEGTGIVVDVGPMPDEVYPMGADHKGSNKLLFMDQGNGFKVGDRVSMVGTIGGFGEYIVSPVNEAIKVPDNVPDDVASLFEPTMITNVIAFNNVRMNDVVFIMGQGALGLLSTQLAKIYGAKTVITSDPVPMKRELSKKLGADYVIDPTTEKVVDRVLELTGGHGVDTIIEAAGVPETISLIPYLGKWGCRVGQIGACCVPVLVDWSYIHFKGYQVTGTNYAMLNMGGMEIAKQRAMEMMASGRLKYDDIITHRLPLTVEATNDIFKKIEKGDEVIKAIYVMDK